MATDSLQSIDWRNASMPGEACFTEGEIQLSEGEALIPDEVRGHPESLDGSGPKFDSLSQLRAVTYADLDGDETDEAFVPLNCNNNGGTGSGALLYSVAVYGYDHGSVRYIGLVTPQQRPPDQLPTLLSDPQVVVGQFTVDETWYGPHDGTCCPSGSALTTWAYEDGHLRVVDSYITADAEQ